MRHQHRHGHVLEQFSADAGEQRVAQRRMVVGAGDDQIGIEIGGARQEHIGNRNVDAQ